MHPDFAIVFETFFNFLDDRKPRSFIAEEVMTFQEVNPLSGRRYDSEFMAKCALRGFSCRAFVLKAGIWLEWPRDRLARMRHFLSASVVLLVKQILSIRL
jgi:hypothetical protein